MAFLTSGGSLVTSSSIVDGEIINDDVSAAAAIAQSKIGIGLNGATDLFSIERTVGTTHSLTTTADQRVLVFAKGDITDGTGSTRSITLSYNAVTKDTVNSQGSGSATVNPFALSYSEVPGAATQNITVAASAGSLANVVITVIKFKSA